MCLCDWVWGGGWLQTFGPRPSDLQTLVGVGGGPFSSPRPARDFQSLPSPAKVARSCQGLPGSARAYQSCCARRELAQACQGLFGCPEAGMSLWPGYRSLLPGHRIMRPGNRAFYGAVSLSSGASSGSSSESPSSEQLQPFAPGCAHASLAVLGYTQKGFLRSLLVLMAGGILSSPGIWFPGGPGV